MSFFLKIISFHNGDIHAKERIVLRMLLVQFTGMHVTPIECIALGAGSRTKDDKQSLTLPGENVWQSRAQQASS